MRAQGAHAGSCDIHSVGREFGMVISDVKRRDKEECECNTIPSLRFKDQLVLDHSQECPDHKNNCGLLQVL